MSLRCLLLFGIGWTLALTACPASRPVARPPAALSADPDRVAFLRGSGLNLPWISYGRDVGWPHPPGSEKPEGFYHVRSIIADRARLPAGMKALRVWMLADDRAGVHGPAADPGFAARCRRDLRAFMDATPADVTVIWVLYDFLIGNGAGTHWGGRSGEHLHLFRGRAAWLAAWKRIAPCIRPIQQEYGPRIIWDLMNEPQNGRDLVRGDRDLAGLEGFLRLHGRRLLRLGGRVTLGARSLLAVRHVWRGLLRDLDHTRRELRLSPDHLVVQFHHYPDHELSRASSLQPFRAHCLRRELGLPARTPVLLGETLPRSRFTLQDLHDRGLAGVLYWQDARRPLTRRLLRAMILGLGRRRTTGGLCEPPVPRPVPAPPGAAVRSGDIPSGRCRIERDGPKVEREWLRKQGYRALAFARLRAAGNGPGGLGVDLDVDSLDPPHAWRRHHKKQGALLCALRPGGRPADLTARRVVIDLTPPRQAVAAAWGSGTQVLLQDAAGRRLHGPWTGLPSLDGGRPIRLSFRPPLRSVPGMGFRHPGFDLARVTHVGLGWAAARHARMRFAAALAVHRIHVGPARGRLPRLAIPPRRPVRPGPLSWERCRFIRSSYVYDGGVAGVVAAPFDLEPQPGPARVRLDLRPDSRFHRTGAVEADLAVSCPGPRGVLLDLTGYRIQARVTGPKKAPVYWQVVLIDVHQTRCHLKPATRLDASFEVRLQAGRRVCSWGHGVDLGRIRRVGLRFHLADAARRPVPGVVKVERLRLLPPEAR